MKRMTITVSYEQEKLKAEPEEQPRSRLSRSTHPASDLEKEDT